MLVRAYTHEAAKKTQVCLDSSCLKILACILYEYEGRDTLVSEACIRFCCLHERNHCIRFRRSTNIHFDIRIQKRIVFMLVFIGCV